MSSDAVLTEFSRARRASSLDSAGGYGVGFDRMAGLGLVAARFEFDIFSHSVTACMNLGRHPLLAH